MNLDTSLAQLETADLVRRAGDASPSLEELAYQFRHALTQETAYDSLLRAKRREIHAQVAHIYEDIYADRLDEIAALLAQHYAEAGEDAKTLEYATRAGDAAARLYANAEAVMHYTRALELVRRDAEMPRGTLPQELFLKRGRMYELSGQYDQALANYEEMEMGAREKCDRGMELAALMARATILSIPTARFEPSRAQPLSDRALALAREMGDRQSEAKILWNLMLLADFTGHAHEAVQWGEQSLAIARELNLRKQIAYTLNDISRLYASTGQGERAQAALLDSRELWRSLDNLPMLADNLGNGCFAAFAQGQYAEAIALGEEGRRISQSIGNLWGQSYNCEMVSLSYVQIGHFDQAIARFEEAFLLGEQAGFLDAQINSRGYLAFVYGRLGSPARGIDLARAAIARARELAPGYLPGPLAILGILELANNHPEQAAAALHESQATLTPEFMDAPAGFFAAIGDGELALFAREYDRAVASMDKELEPLRKLGIGLFISEALLIKGKALRALGKRDEAFAALSEARQAAGNSRQNLWQTLFHLSEIEAERGNSLQAQSLRNQGRAMVEEMATHTPIDLRTAFLNLTAVCGLFEPG